jgi:homoserine acetyltransferase
VEAAYREIASDKGHDAFLVEWDQLTAILGDLLGSSEAAQRGGARVAASA